MKYIRLAHVVLSTLLLAGCELSIGAEVLKGEVVAVTDGDTLTLQTKAGKREKIRLQGVDAPERDQAYGDESYRLLHLLLFNKKVTVRAEGRDDYDRVLGVVFHKGTDINLEMVKRGAAWHYRHYAPDNKELADAEKAARSRHLGLWEAARPTAPWDFRHGIKTQPITESVNVAESGALQGICCSVADGDTLTVRLPDGKKEKVQLFGIDAPERDQKYGSEATSALAALVLNKKIRVAYPGREDLGRINGKVYVDGKYVNLILVKEGHAWHSDKYGPNEDDLRAAQQEAREAGKGLWADARPLEPWRFRNGYY